MIGQRSPFVVRALLAWLLPSAAREFVLGDLEELYERRRTRRGRLRADAWYCRAALSVVVGRERLRSGRGGLVSWGGLLIDARASFRSLRRTPSFTAVASGTLALGLGVTIAVYAMADLMLRPPPGVHGADRVAYIVFGAADDANDVAYLSPTDVADFRAATVDVVEAFAAVTAGPAHVRADGADPISAQVGYVEGPLFQLLGVRASLGRLPGGDELGTIAPWSVAVISERLWSTLLSRDPAAVGRTVRVNGQPLTVIGVTADGFAGLQRDAPVDIWLPASALIPVLNFDRDRLNSRQAALYPHLVGRLRPGVTGEAATMRLVAAAERITQSLPEGENTLNGNVPRLHRGIHITPEARAQTRQSLRILAVVVALVLFVACANVANLLLFRALRGRHEVLVRRALGASRRRIVVQQMIGNALLAFAGMVAGLGAAWLITRLFAGQKMLGMPAFDSLALDARLLLFTAVATAGTAMLAGALPAWVASQAASASPAHAEGTRSTSRHERLRGSMTVVQLTASLALIVAAMLLMRTVAALYAIDPGFTTAGVYVVPLNFPDTHDPATRLAAYARAEEAAGVPGVERVALDDAGPLVPRLRGPVTRSNSAPADRTTGIVTFVTPDWFDVMNVRVLRGRAFASEDRGPAGTARVIVSEGLARTVFGDEDPVGRTIRAFGRRHDVEVIGVAEDIRYSRILSDPEPVAYHPWSEPFFLSTTVLLYRATQGDGAATATAVRDALTRADPLIAIDRPRPLMARLDEQLADHRLFAQLLALLSLLAALLAGVGLYGVVAYGVADRTREFGIRMALGAPAAGIVRLVLRQLALTIAAGTVFGLAAAALLARALAGRLHGVSALDPLTYASAILALAGVAAIACAGPARSATRVDLMLALRQD